jgi:hypothetical protein
MTKRGFASATDFQPLHGPQDGILVSEAASLKGERQTIVPATAAKTDWTSRD